MNDFWQHPEHFEYYVRGLLILLKSSLVSGSYPVLGLGVGSGLLCGRKKVTFGESVF